ncbi:MAG: 16S rRNA (cytidine(1402)-2'-O)-methyltransferase [Verrucomicrobia bacterium]|jgi:16S rRNA (cytidine1402-2'-O)-methyltransferase|nr:16S rRNA (cytidine(1402)-2'-O)-methyltransferase [Verrucomicrobiota bacterium]TSA36329.1 MAG: 16S rRNA (cytidine(1402)-2'-O)-methyltransferase [Opitutales bacterium]
MPEKTAGVRGNPPGSSGRLWVVATPLGNLGDITLRAKEAIATCDLVACEDTRVTGGLLRHLSISKPMLAYHEHNEKEVAVQIADKIAGGANIALITDAGTPGISDPGFRVTRECRKRGLTVTPLPGPCAIIALLSASGLPTNAFRFIGFLPPKSAARMRFLESIKTADETVVLHESCHRISDFLDEMLEVLGADRVVCVGRELTKLHETIRTAPLRELVPALKAGSLKGEFTVAIAPAEFGL